MRCVASIQAQSLFYMPNPIAARLGAKTAFTPEEVEALADHMTAFSLAGIRAATAAGQAAESPRPNRGPAPLTALGAR